MARLIINEDDGVEDAVSNITTHTKLPSSEARKLVRQARLRAAKEYKLPTHVADSDQDPPNAPPGFGAAWRQRASRAAMGDRTALFASDDNMPDDPKSKIEIMIQQVEDKLDSLKKEFSDLLSSDESVNETIKKTEAGYKLVSKSGKNLGEYPTKAGAEKRERQVNYFKHQNESKATKVDQLVSEMLHYARTNEQRLFKESVIQLQRYVRNDFPRVAKYIIESVSLGIKEAKRSKYGLPPISEDASSGASCSSSVASVPGNLLAEPQKPVIKRKQPAKTPLVDKLDDPEKTPIKNKPGLPDGVGTGVYESKDPVAAIQKKIDSLEKKYDTMKGQLGMAKEKRRMKGERLLSTREQTLQTKMSEVYAQILELKQEKKELSKAKVSEGRFVKGPGGVPSDKYGNPLPPKEPKAKLDKFGLTKSDYNQIWNEVETVVSNIFPDGDPNDFLPRILRKYGIADYDVEVVLEKTARLNGFRDIYDYWNSLEQEHGDTFESYNPDVSEGRFVKGPGGVPCDKYGNPVKTSDIGRVQPKAKTDEFGLTDSDYNQIWRQVEDVVGNIFPDGDPIDYLPRILRKYGISQFDNGEVLEKAAKMNGYEDVYDYWNSLKADYGDQYEDEGRQRLSDSVETTTRETYDDFIDWRSTAKQCNCMTKRMADGYYSAFDQDNNLVGEWDESQAEGWLDCGTCDLDEELVNELSPAAHQRYVTAANRSRSEMTDKMRDQGVFDPAIDRKMGDRAERTMKSINKLTSGNVGFNR